MRDMVTVQVDDGVRMRMSRAEAAKRGLEPLANTKRRPPAKNKAAEPE